jgi:LacI family transcriptional regulator, galactose operon repressor
MMRKTKKHVTLRDVAAEASVSLTTVSNFVNDRYRFMSATTRQRVQRAIEKLNYRPHGIARSLRLAEWRSIGIIIVDESPTYLADDITTYIIAGLSNFLTGHGFNLVVQGLRAAKFESSPLVSHLRTDGLCVMLSGRHRERRSLLNILLQLNQPIVVFQDSFHFRGTDICTVMQDDEGAGEMLAAHVVERGSRRIVFLMPEHHNWAGIDARLRGVRNYVRGHRAAASVRTVTCRGRDPAAIWDALDQDYAENGPADAVLSNTDEMALAVCKYVLNSGRRIPQDVKVTGYNATNLWKSATPTLTTIPSRGYELGEIAGELMLTRLREGRFAKRRINLPLSLQVGQSTEN